MHFDAIENTKNDLLVALRWDGDSLTSEPCGGPGNHPREKPLLLVPLLILDVAIKGTANGLEQITDNLCRQRLVWTLFDVWFHPNF
jgi:hypothetical protein